MIVLDTNVLSEAVRPTPAPQVIEWIDAQHVETLYVSVLTVAELRLGLAVLPDGARRSMLTQRLEDEVFPLFEGRVLPVDGAVALEFARLQAAARSGGMTMPVIDALIAATCSAHRFTLATRNVADFAASGVPLIDPWRAPGASGV
ncbi:type II toxin-antitoxin system VapC family toxin [Sanguibacter sp. HDW7]|uniref:type II toxin-antitoxin system VapC family toxin n=1 Tax=Sanguibacter sp. HDW7 TaxID=2714931 RepID=UPI00140A1312|nr:type II toxin-antitoxin system VapC family toxin [Sanguibacter sp. HDW7]QIK84704.1 type II toxin-antitoxin system VapC family toxin [Sanguibacter sp. HDW7]